MKRVLIVLSVLAVFLGACGGDDKKNASSPRGDKSATTRAGDATDSGENDDDDAGGGDLKAKLLVASDLPDGFKRTLAEERDPAKEEKSESNSQFCKELDQLDDDFPGEREAEANFERTTSAGGSYVNQQIARFKDGDEADKAFSAFENGFSNCTSFSEQNDGGTTTGSFEKTDFANAGDDTYATLFKASQSTSDGQSIALEGYFVALRDGEHIMLLVALGLGDEVSKADLETIAKKAVAKL